MLFNFQGPFLNDSTGTLLVLTKFSSLASSSFYLKVLNTLLSLLAVFEKFFSRWQLIYYIILFFFCQDFFLKFFLRIFWSLFLKNCWYFVFATLFWRVPYYNTKSFCFCQDFFKTFFKVFSEVWQALILCCIHSLDCFENILIHRLSGLSFSLSRRVLIYNTTRNWFCQHLFWKNLNFFFCVTEQRIFRIVQEGTFRGGEPLAAGSPPIQLNCIWKYPRTPVPLRGAFTGCGNIPAWYCRVMF